MPTSSRTSRQAAPVAAALAILVSLALAGACARGFRPGAPQTMARAKQAESYSGEIRLDLRGPDLRARTPVLVGFRRPDALRIEVPGPGSARLLAVARAGRFVAVFPAQRAFFEGDATPAVLEALFGVPLDPSEVMDLLIGVEGDRVREYRADWGPTLPERIEAVLPDGGRLKLRVVAADLDPALPEEAFAAPVHDGFRRVDAEEARTLWQ